MRRNFPRTNKPAGQNGPLMTNHIELQNLDLELELLKRKREIIEKQQMQLTNERQYNDRQRQYNYNEPSQLYHGQQQQYNSNQNFSNNFGQSSAPPLMGGHFGGSVLGKRPSESKWNPNSAPKRFSGPQGGSKKKFGGAAPNRRSDPIDRPAPFAKNQGPTRSQNSQPKTPVQPWNNQLPFYMGTSSVPPSQRFSSSRSRPVQRDFKPSKVTKPKPTTSNLANKLVSYPIPKRKEYPTETPKLANKVEEPRDAFILHADRVPSQQVAGRLELGLGTILKDVKQQFAENDLYRASFLSHIFMREVKQAIRERLRTVMIGKHVGKVGPIVEEYRKVFPLESDSEIVTVASEAVKAANNKQISIRLENTDTPESYFKTNMDQLICKTLDEMFNKIRSIYGGDHGDHPEEVQQTVRELMEEDPQAFSRDFEFYNDNVSTEEKDKNDESVKKDATTEEKEKNGESDKKEGETDKKEEATDKKDEENDKKDEEKEVVNASNDEPKEDEPKIETGTKTNANTSNAADVKVEEQAPLNDQQLKHRIKKMEYVIGYMLKRRIAVIFPKYKNLLSRILNENSQYLEAKEAILAKLQDKLSIETRMEAAKLRDAKNTSNTSMTSQRSAPAASTPTAAPKFLPYYVKIFGRPGLPRRKQMHTFLQQFSPKSIKKHKTLNLLFVGFNNKEDFDKILAVKETVLGNCKIRINVSDKNVKGSENESLNVSAISGEADDDVQLVEGDSLNSSGIINADLDDQIDNLLSSIRQEEEKSNEDDNVGKEAPAANNGASDDVVAVEGSEKGQSEVPAKANDVVDADLTENDQSEKTPANGNAADVPVEDKNEEIPEGDKPMDTEPSEKTDNEEADKLAALKNEEKDSGRATPTRASARIATPSNVRTRRASRLAQN